jgi:hypothetical protein
LYQLSQNGRAEIEERALVLRETTRHKDKVAKQLEDCLVIQGNRKRCNTDMVSPGDIYNKRLLDTTRSDF